MTTGTATRPPASRLIPTGRYALVNNQDHKVYFFTVDRPTEGKWAGFTFLAMMHGENHEPVKGLPKMQILRAIAENPMVASARYGREIGKCGVCHRALTDALSRADGIGPVCKKNLGW